MSGVKWLMGGVYAVAGGVTWSNTFFLGYSGWGYMGNGNIFGGRRWGYMEEFRWGYMEEFRWGYMGSRRSLGGRRWGYMQY